MPLRPLTRISPKWAFDVPHKGKVNALKTVIPDQPGNPLKVGALVGSEFRIFFGCRFGQFDSAGRGGWEEGENYTDSCGAKISLCLTRFGAASHTVRLMPASYVKAYVRRSKNDAADAAAICEAVTRPNMRFVPVKTAGQQAALMLHRTRDLLIRQRTQLINALRAHLAELGIVAAAGVDG